MNVAKAVKNGENFSRALGGYPKVFNSILSRVLYLTEKDEVNVEILVSYGYQGSEPPEPEGFT